MLPDVTRAGRVAGLVFALGTLGCLVGNYATGFWLMADYTLNAITIGVAVGPSLLAVPMFLADYRLDPVVGGRPGAGGGVNRADDPLGFRTDIRRAFAVVFLASFCGMSLELTGVARPGPGARGLALLLDRDHRRHARRDRVRQLPGRSDRRPRSAGSGCSGWPS